MLSRRRALQGPLVRAEAAEPGLDDGRSPAIPSLRRRTATWSDPRGRARRRSHRSGRTRARGRAKARRSPPVGTWDEKRVVLEQVAAGGEFEVQLEIRPLVHVAQDHPPRVGTFGLQGVGQGLDTLAPLGVHLHGRTEAAPALQLAARRRRNSTS